MRRWLVQVLTPIVCATALLFGIVAMGRAARAGLHDHPAYTLAFDDLDCQPPPGMDRGAFLQEARLLTRQPNVVHLLDDDAAARLRRAFAVHPWVQSVRRVEIVPTGRTQTRIQIELLYRRAVLAVGLSNEEKDEKRMVDGHAILLPLRPQPKHLPLFVGDAKPPAGPAGTGWGDPRIAAAAKTVAFLSPYLTRLGLDECAVESIDGELVLRRPDVRIVWGHAPGQERPGEASAQMKLRRLLDYRNGHDGLQRLEHDVRLSAYQGHFPLFTASVADRGIAGAVPTTRPY